MMPKYPNLSKRLDTISGSVFEKYLPRMREKGQDLVRLHLGDCYLPPSYTLPIDSDFRTKYPHFSRYCNTMGVHHLREVLAQKLHEDNQIEAAPDDILVTCGAANALSISCMSLLDPGEELIILTPIWPFFFGMVKIADGKIIEVPFYDKLYKDPQMDISTYLNQFVTSKTAALYVNTPNNPTGKVLNQEQLQQIADFTRQHQLWLISDEAYDGMTYENNRHLSIASFPEMFERTLTVFTFSKVYMFAGLRLGYMVAPNSILKAFNKMLLHQLYSPSTFTQYLIIDPIKTRSLWARTYVKHCQELRDIFASTLSIPHQTPEGSYFLFLPVKDVLKGRDYWKFIEDCLEAGVSVSPGKDFGKHYADYVRICFASESPERLKQAIKRLNKLVL